jgi:hypothetical protein
VHTRQESHVSCLGLNLSCSDSEELSQLCHSDGVAKWFICFFEEEEEEAFLQRPPIGGGGGGGGVQVYSQLKLLTRRPRR